MIAYNTDPKVKHSLVNLCNELSKEPSVGLRTIDKYISDKKISSDYYIEHNKLIISATVFGNQHYFEIIYGMGFDRIPRVIDMLFTDNVKEDLIKLLTK
jgi:hypothetical protein